ncbi:hypothetical protein ACMFMG_007516 [Clarireedia jacksonii]
MSPNDNGKYAFITSTPSFSAKEKKETRTLVRKHVMRPFMKQNRPKRVNGLKAIAPRNAPPTPSTSGLQSGLDNLKVTDTKQPGEEEENGALMVPQISSMLLLGGGRANPFQSYPITIGEKQHELIHYLWKPSETNIQPFREFWYPLGLADAAAMHLILSNVSRHLDRLRGQPGENTDAVTHYISAIKSVNTRLKSMSTSDAGMTDGIMGAILGFMCHDHIRADAESFFIHHAGFQKILAMRGGLSSIEKNIPLRLSLLWIEYNMVSDLDVPPTFPPPYRLLGQTYTQRYEEQGQVHFSRIFTSFVEPNRVGSDMLDIMKSLSNLTIGINEECKTRNLWHDQNFPGLCIYPILYRLLTAQTTVENNLEELLRIGALLFVSEVRRKFGIGPILTGVYVSKLRKHFEDTESWGEDDRKLKTWLLVMAAYAASSTGDYQWAVDGLKEMMGGDSWDDIEKEGKRMWFIEEIFGPHLLKLQMEVSS